jgi:hypothetical protein
VLQFKIFRNQRLVHKVYSTLHALSRACARIGSIIHRIVTFPGSDGYWGVRVADVFIPVVLPASDKWRSLVRQPLSTFSEHNRNTTHSSTTSSAPPEQRNVRHTQTYLTHSLARRKKMAQAGGTYRTAPTRTSVDGKTTSSRPVVVKQQHSKPLHLLVLFV